MADLWGYPTNVTNFNEIILESNLLTGDMVSVGMLLGIMFISFIISSRFKNPAQSFMYSSYVTAIAATIMFIGGMLAMKWAVATWVVTAMLLFIMHLSSRDFGI